MQQFWIPLAVAILSGLVLAHYKGLVERTFQLTLRNDAASRKLVLQVALTLLGLGFLLGMALTGSIKILDFKRDLAGVVKEQGRLLQENERLQAEVQIYHQTFIEENPNKALVGNIKYTPRSRYCQEKGYSSRDCLQRWSLERSALIWKDAFAQVQEKNQEGQ